MSGGGLGGSGPSSSASACRRVVGAERGGDVHDGLREPGRECGTDRLAHDVTKRWPSWESRCSTNGTTTVRGREGLAHHTGRRDQHQEERSEELGEQASPFLTGSWRSSKIAPIRLPSLRSTASACWELTTPSVARTPSPRRTTPTRGVPVMTRRTTGCSRLGPGVAAQHQPIDDVAVRLAARSQSSAPRPSSAASDSAPGQHPTRPTVSVRQRRSLSAASLGSAGSSPVAPRPARPDPDGRKPQDTTGGRVSCSAPMRPFKPFGQSAARDFDLALVSASSGGSNDAAEAEV